MKPKTLYGVGILLLVFLLASGGVALAWSLPSESRPSARLPMHTATVNAYNTVITVTTTADPDDDQQYVCYTAGVGQTPRTPCTLRQALEESHTLDPSAGPILITFDLPDVESHNGSGDDYWVIQLAETGYTNALPDVGNQTTIDGSTQPGGRSDGPKIILRGPENVPEGYALVLEEGSTVRGLAFQKFRMHVQINGSDNTVEDSWFGLDDDGMDVYLRDEEHPEDGSGQSGVSTADNNTNNTIQNNVLTHFRAAAINVRGDSSSVLSNTVGTLADGT
ncbi:MAG: hypothetical protein JXA33_19565, partial [Anaerolineae bacterium]|nr:hypothetical protein [Anaerolineae bacterium]